MNSSDTNASSIVVSQTTTAHDIYQYLQEIKLLPTTVDPACIQLCTMSRSPKVLRGLSTVGEYGLSALSHLWLHVTMLGGSSEGKRNLHDP